MTEEQLDRYRHTYELAEEEYTQALDEYEATHGTEEREKYENASFLQTPIARSAGVDEAG